MSFCPKCGAEVGDAAFCTNCGQVMQQGTLDSVQNVAAEQPAAPVYQQSAYQQPAYQQPPAQQPQQPYYVPQPVAPVPTGGLIAWSIITLLLCTIPGIVGLVQACGINKTYTVEEQQKKIKSCKVWNIVGCVLGGLYLILAVIGYLAA